MTKKLKLDQHDEAVVVVAIKAIDDAVADAHNPVAVVKRIVVRAMQHRNKGRDAAKKEHPFRDICEISGLSIKSEIAALDEIEAEKGYSGELRWVCQKANNSGRGSCGRC